MHRKQKSALDTTLFLLRKVISNKLYFKRIKLIKYLIIFITNHNKKKSRLSNNKKKPAMWKTLWPTVNKKQKNKYNVFFLLFFVCFVFVFFFCT